MPKSGDNRIGSLFIVTSPPIRLRPTRITHIRRRDARTADHWIGNLLGYFAAGFTNPDALPWQRAAACAVNPAFVRRGFHGSSDAFSCTRFCTPYTTGAKNSPRAPRQALRTQRIPRHTRAGDAAPWRHSARSLQV